MKRDILTLTFPAKAQYVLPLRLYISGVATRMDFAVDAIEDIKTAVSEAVTNCIVHAYGNEIGQIYISCSITGEIVKISVRDNGAGIADVKLAMEPEFTTAPEGERSGLGFSVMAAFMDKVSVRSKLGKGTTVTLTKLIKSKEAKC